MSGRRKWPGSDRAVGAIALVALTALRPCGRNPRRWSEDRLAQLQQALRTDPEMLWARPLIALANGTVICGNMRLEAARRLGWEALPVLRVELDPERARLWALRDNNAYGEWDEPALAELLAELADEGVELGLAGFAGADLDRILGSIVMVRDPDEAPEPPAGEPVSLPGELYELGRHRLLCGDARDPVQLARLAGREQVAVLLSDPPYGVEYVGKTRRALRIRNDDPEGLDALLEQVLGAVDPLLEPGGRFYLFAPAGPLGTVFRNELGRVGWRHHQTLAWCKNAIVLGHSDYHYQHEEVLYGWKPGPGRLGRGRHAGSRWYGDNRQSSLLVYDRPARSETHPTMKPVALLEALLCNSSRRDELVLDPFAGSGSTLIACERLGRRCLAVELDPGYCDVIRRRYQELTGE